MYARLGSGDAAKCELMTKKEETFTLPGCSNWLPANAGATGYYRTAIPQKRSGAGERC